MSDILLGDPPPDPVKTLRRAFRRFQIMVLLALAAMAAFLAWEARQDRATLHSMQRPIVVLHDIKFLPVERGNSGLYWQFIADWQNTGLTTARNVQTHVHYWTGPVAPGFTHMTPNDFTGQYFDLSPHETINTPDFMAPAQAMLGPKASAGEMVIWGQATYHEGQAGGRPHITHFCYAVTWVGGDPNNAQLPLDVRTNHCEEGNCMDDECIATGYAPTPPS
jgi:hypothetical protein